jgi:hypothetical protein
MSLLDSPRCFTLKQEIQIIPNAKIPRLRNRNDPGRLDHLNSHDELIGLVDNLFTIRNI